MFYSTELLSLRRKGKLARCWLAATMSEKMFKRSVKPPTIEKIDVPVLCAEILSAIQGQSSKVYSRFSLYLSSQLMYGTTKILFYQTKQLQDYLFSINWKIFAMNSGRVPFQLEMAFEVKDIPPVTKLFCDLNVARDMHLITENVYSSVIQHKMQEELNFGALTDYEMEKFLLLLQADEQSLDEVRRIPEQILSVPPIDLNNLEDMNKTDEEVQTPPAIRAELPVAEDAEFKSPITHGKRKAKLVAETISKRRKISSIDEVPLPVHIPAAEETPSLIPEEPSMPVLPDASAVEPQESSVQKPMPVLQKETPDHVPPLTEDTTVVLTQRPRKRKIFDNEIQLSDAVMQERIGDITIHTMDHIKLPAKLPSTIEYLKQPSTKISHKVLAEKLTKLFSRHMTTRRIEDNEFPSLELDKESVRGYRSIIHEKTNEMSSAIAILPAEMSEQSKTIENLNQIEDVQIEALRPAIEEFTEASLEITTGFKEKFGKMIESSRKSLNGKIRKTASKTSSVVSLSAQITKSEFKALLDVHWRENTIIKFHNIISPDSYTKTDAASAFQYCLELHAEKYLVLKQRECFDIIWIERYPEDSLDSADGDLIDDRLFKIQ